MIYLFIFKYTIHIFLYRCHLYHPMWNVCDYLSCWDNIKTLSAWNFSCTWGATAVSKYSASLEICTLLIIHSLSLQKWTLEWMKSVKFNLLFIGDYRSVCLWPEVKKNYDEKGEKQELRILLQAVMMILFECCNWVTCRSEAGFERLVHICGRV